MHLILDVNTIQINLRISCEAFQNVGHMTKSALACFTRHARCMALFILVTVKAGMVVTPSGISVKNCCLASVGS